MPRIRVGEIRRKQLIDATISSIHKYGFYDATVSRIASEVGISAGNIHHYFGGKDGLLEATMRSLMKEVNVEMVKRLSAAATPVDRVRAVISANLAPRLFQPQICRAWLHFWAQAPHYQPLERLEHVNATRFRRNLQHALKQVIPAKHVPSLTNEIVALIDGLWVQRAQADGGFTPEAAQELALAFLESRLSTHSGASPGKPRRASS